MEQIEEIRKHYRLTDRDEARRRELADILGPLSEEMARDFVSYVLSDPEMAAFLPTDAAVDRRRETIRKWFEDLFTARYNSSYLMRIWRIGKVHVKIGLKGHYVNASMNMVRTFCIKHITRSVSERDRRETLIETVDKILDINLDVLTSSYREEELKKVFLSHRVESLLVRSAERIMHGLNLILMIGLLVMAGGVVSLLAADIFYALTTSLENGVIKALGSLLILWMMIELLHAHVQHLRGGKFNVRVFVELALVAFIRKLFIASIEEKDPITFALLLGGLLILGLIFWFTGREAAPSQRKRG